MNLKQLFKRITLFSLFTFLSDIYFHAITKCELCNLSGEMGEKRFSGHVIISSFNTSLFILETSNSWLITRWAEQLSFSPSCRASQTSNPLYEHIAVSFHSWVSHQAQMPGVMCLYTQTQTGSLGVSQQWVVCFNNSSNT